MSTGAGVLSPGLHSVGSLIAWQFFQASSSRTPSTLILPVAGAISKWAAAAAPALFPGQPGQRWLPIEAAAPRQ